MNHTPLLSVRHSKTITLYTNIRSFSRTRREFFVAFILIPNQTIDKDGRQNTANRGKRTQSGWRRSSDLDEEWRNYSCLWAKDYFGSYLIEEQNSFLIRSPKICAKVFFWTRINSTLLEFLYRKTHRNILHFSLIYDIINLKLTNINYF